MYVFLGKKIGELFAIKSETKLRLKLTGETHSLLFYSLYGQSIINRHRSYVWKEKGSIARRRKR